MLGERNLARESVARLQFPIDGPGHSTGEYPMLDQMFILALPFILMAAALALDSTIFGFFGGITAIFVGLTLLDVVWAMMIFLGLGIYFILISVLANWEE